MERMQGQLVQLAAAAAADVVLSQEVQPAAAVAHLEAVAEELGALQREAEHVVGLQRTFQVGGGGGGGGAASARVYQRGGGRWGA
jgi:hypothetical protein